MNHAESEDIKILAQFPGNSISEFPGIQPEHAIYLKLMIELDSCPLFPLISSSAPSDTKCSTYELKALVIWPVKLVLYSYFSDLTNEIGLKLDS